MPHGELHHNEDDTTISAPFRAVKVCRGLAPCPARDPRPAASSAEAQGGSAKAARPWAGSWLGRVSDPRPQTLVRAQGSTAAQDGRVLRCRASARTSDSRPATKIRQHLEPAEDHRLLVDGDLAHVADLRVLHRPRKPGLLSRLIGPLLPTHHDGFVGTRLHGEGKRCQLAERNRRAPGLDDAGCAVLLEDLRHPFGMGLILRFPGGGHRHCCTKRPKAGAKWPFSASSSVR